MRITCVGGGPAGLTLAILAQQTGHEVTVLERQQPAASFGWGVVFWEGLLDDVTAHDRVLADQLREHAYTWRDQIMTVDASEPVRIPSYGYSMRRRTLLELLRCRAESVGVRIAEQCFDGDLDSLPGELVIGCDGVGSAIRRTVGGFGTTQTTRTNRYAWFGTDHEFDSFTFPFVSTPHGWLWAHAYGFEPGMSTFVVETAPRTWRGLGLDRADGQASATLLQEWFAGPLGGARLQPQPSLRDRSPWLQFTVIDNRRWHRGRFALMGDAAHTTHFSIGSGTRLAMEDAMALSDALADEPALEAALTAYEARRRTELRVSQLAAGHSARWFERLPRYIERPMPEFTVLLVHRRSRLMGRLPVGAYLRLKRLKHSIRTVGGSVRRVVSHS